MENLKSIIESLLFVSDEPLTIERLKSVLSPAAASDIRSALNLLAEEYEADAQRCLEESARRSTHTLAIATSAKRCPGGWAPRRTGVSFPWSRAGTPSRSSPQRRPFAKSAIREPGSNTAARA